MDIKAKLIKPINFQGFRIEKGVIFKVQPLNVDPYYSSKSGACFYYISTTDDITDINQAMTSKVFCAGVITHDELREYFMLLNNNSKWTEWREINNNDIERGILSLNSLENGITIMYYIKNISNQLLSNGCKLYNHLYVRNNNKKVEVKYVYSLNGEEKTLKAMACCNTKYDTFDEDIGLGIALMKLCNKYFQTISNDIISKL